MCVHFFDTVPRLGAVYTPVLIQKEKGKGKGQYLSNLDYFLVSIFIFFKKNRTTKN